VSRFKELKWLVFRLYPLPFFLNSPFKCSLLWFLYWFGKETNKFTVTMNREYKKTESTNSVQSNLKSHPSSVSNPVVSLSWPANDHYSFFNFFFQKCLEFDNGLSCPCKDSVLRMFVRIWMKFGLNISWIIFIKNLIANLSSDLSTPSFLHCHRYSREIKRLCASKH